MNLSSRLYVEDRPRAIYPTRYISETKSRLHNGMCLKINEICNMITPSMGSISLFYPYTDFLVGKDPLSLQKSCFYTVLMQHWIVLRNRNNMKRFFRQW